MISNYECSCAKNLRILGIVLQVLFCITGVVLLFALFDDWNMMWLYAIGSCAGCWIAGFIDRYLFECVAVITENKYQDYKQKHEAGSLSKKEIEDQLPVI